MSSLTEPFAMLPNSIRKAGEHLEFPENQRDAVKQQIGNVKTPSCAESTH
jgi:hypothetical protein